VIATDLYRENFDPLLSAVERRSYYAPVSLRMRSRATPIACAASKA
jgi:hypothetical protein